MGRFMGRFMGNLTVLEARVIADMARSVADDIDEYALTGAEKAAYRRGLAKLRSATNRRLSMEWTHARESVPPSELISTHGVRELCGGISRPTLLAWRETLGFPPPIAHLPPIEIWDRRDVKAWIRQNRQRVRDAKARTKGRA